MKVQDLDIDFDFDDLIEAADANASSDWAMQFVADMRARFAEYGDEMFVSDSQLEKLKQIAKVA